MCTVLFSSLSIPEMRVLFCLTSFVRTKLSNFHRPTWDDVFTFRMNHSESAGNVI